MDLNPFTYIEKYITEHGSAAVLEKHLALIKDQLAASESKLVEADARTTLADQRTALASERAALAESRATKAEELVAELQQRIRDLAEKGDVLPEPQAKILQLLHHNDSLSVEQIAGSIGISAPDTKGHLDALSADEYVRRDLNKSMGISSVIGRSALVASRGGRQTSSQKSLGHYYIKEKGRAYVMKMG